MNMLMEQAGLCRQPEDERQSQRGEDNQKDTGKLQDVMMGRNEMRSRLTPNREKKQR